VKRVLPRVVVLADREALAARLEAALRDIAQVRVVIGRATALADVIEEHDPTAVVLASTMASVAAALAAAAGVFRLPPVVLLVDEPRVAWTVAARQAGVRAVLGREASGEEVRAALGAATAGLIALHPDVFRAGIRASDAGEDRALTPRERELLEMLAEGLSNRTIAHRLGISTNTVKFHVASILDKLGVGSRTEAVTLGVRRGLIAL
jgi:DNA-binding NarL/FixJ family response regulator